MRKRPKSLDAPIVQEARALEVWAYGRCDEWKAKYRHTLVHDFRRHISEARESIIRGFEIPNRFAAEKLMHYTNAQVELALAEGCMDIMIDNSINVMSEKDWSKAAIGIDTIRIGLARLASSLTHKGVGGPESPDCGMGSAHADNKDV